MTGARLYRLLLRLYPRPFRDRFGDDMAECVGARLADARRSGGGRALAAAWARTAADLVHTAALERAAALAALLAERRRARDFPPTDPAPGTAEMLPSVLRDLRYAWRGMRQRPGFTAVVLATLALGVGANVAIFSVVNGVLLRPLPYEDPDRVVRISNDASGGTISEPEFADYRREATALGRVAAYAVSRTYVAGEPGAEQVAVARVSDGFFGVLGVAPRLGRAFAPDEERRGAPDVIVLGHALWQRRFGGDPRVVGRDVRIGARPFTVVGVMPPSFEYPARDVAAWVPLRLNYDSLWTRNNHYLTLVARLAPDASVERAETELRALGRRFARDFPESYPKGSAPVPVVASVREALVGRTRPYLLALVGAVGFVLLIACVNVANLFLARGEMRRREVAVRAAIGAPRRRLARQALTESALHAVVGGALGLALAWLGVRGLVALAPDALPRIGDVRVDGAALLFATLVAGATGALFGIVPALRGTRAEAAETLRQSGGARAPMQGRALARVRGALVVAEVGLAVVTLCGAGLMLRSLQSLGRVDLGFAPEGALTARVALPAAAYPTARRVQFYRDLEARLRAIPGVRAAGAIADLPIADPQNGWSIHLDGRQFATIGEAPYAAPEQVTPGAFRAMGIELVRGRTFTDADREGAPGVVVVNEAMAKQLWPGRDAIGRTLKMFSDDAEWATVVGVVRDVRSRGFLDDAPATMYFPHAQAARTAYVAPATMSLVVRTAGDPAAVAGAVRAAVRALDRDAPVMRVLPLADVVNESIAGRRFTTRLLAGFAAVALALAGIGIYGLMSYDVSQRTYEIGVRRALGAQSSQILRLTMSRGARLAAAGLVGGVAGALVVTRLLGAVLVDVKPTDPLTLGGVALVLGAVAAVACYLPARRAGRVSPVEAIRAD
jgi:putative ABC transport system permease protein